MFTAETLVARSQRRRMRATHVVIAVVVGVTAAFSIALIAGARRSSTVVDRFLAAAPRYDLVTESTGIPRSDVVSLPGVEAASTAAYVAIGTPVGPGEFVPVNGVATDFAVPNPDIRVLAGAWPAFDDPTKIVVNEAYVERFGGKPGDVLTMATFGLDQGDEVDRGVYQPRGRQYTFTIAAIARYPTDIVTDGIRAPVNRTNLDEVGVLLAGRFYEDHHDEFLDFGGGVLVLLNDGPAGIPSFLDALASRLGVTPSEVQWEPYTDTDQRNGLEPPVNVETTTLLAIGIGTAVATLAATVILLLLERRRLERESIALRHIGMTSRQVALCAALRLAPVAIAAGAIAVLGAIGASGAFPIGIGRQLELDAGIRFDAIVALGGLLAAVSVVLVSMALAKLDGRRTGRAASALPIAMSAPLPVALGLHLATGNRLRRRAATLAELGTVAIAIAAVVMVAVWVTGVRTIINDPGRRGFVWDVAIGNPNFDMDPEHVAELQADPRVVGSTTAAFGRVPLNGTTVEILIYDPGGTAPPDVTAGRLPALIDEVALGAGAMRTLGVGIGDTVTMSVANTDFVDEGTPAGEVELRVVGQSMVPSFGESDMAYNGIVPFDAIDAAGGDTSVSYVLVDVDDAVRDRSITGLASDYTDEMMVDNVPARVMNLDRVRELPVAGVAVVAVVGAAILVASLVASGRGNRQALAVLRCLGLARATQRCSLAWQGLAVGLGVIVVGIAVGLWAGSVLWGRVVTDLGLHGGIAVPASVIALAAAGATLTSVATAVIAGSRSQGARLTALLRAE